MFRRLLSRTKETGQSTAVHIPRHLQGDGREEDGFLVIGETAIERSTVGPQSRPHTSIAAEDLPPSYSQVSSTQSPRSSYPPPSYTSLTMGQQQSNISSADVGSECVLVENDIPDFKRLERADLIMHRPGDYHSPLQTPRLSTQADTRSVISTLPGEVFSETDLWESDFRVSARTPQDHDGTAVSDIPFQLSPWLQQSNSLLLDSETDHIRITPVDLSQFHYDFTTEKRIISEAMLLDL